MAATLLCGLLTDLGGLNVGMTRTGDTFPSLSERAAYANACKAPLLSIHCNAGGGFGFEAFTTPGETGSDLWATVLLNEYQKDFPDLKMRVDLGDGDPDKEARFTVLTKTVREAVLFELHFIDTDAGEAFLQNPVNQRKMAVALFRATMKWLKNRTPEVPEGYWKDARTNTRRRETLVARAGSA